MFTNGLNFKYWNDHLDAWTRFSLYSKYFILNIKCWRYENTIADFVDV